MIELECQVDNIFFSADSGYLAFRAKTDQGNEITVVGNIQGVAVLPGDKFKLRGVWKTHKVYGKQFEIKQWQVVETDRVLNQFKTFLSSGAIRGIGPAMATRIIKKFGSRTPEVFENSIDELLKVDGIGKTILKQIIKSWDEVKHHHFLYGLGISAKSVKKILEIYGAAAEERIKENPYVLAEDIEGIGFARADQIAEQLGISKDSPFRIKAALIHTLNDSSSMGHCYLTEKNLIFETQLLTKVKKEKIEQTLQQCIKNMDLIKVNDLIGTRQIVNTERAIAHILRDLSGPSNLFSEHDIIKDCVDLAPFELDPLQVDAIKTALLNKVSVITGFPGSGKSLCTKTIIDILSKHGIPIQLLAPTGRASKRLTEVTGRKASTIHRFLIKQQCARGEYHNNFNFIPDDDEYDSSYSHNSKDYTVFIVDEASMIDVFLLRKLLEEVNNHIVFIGDVDQLPPVGPGNTLRDIIDCQCFPCIKLTKIFRQEEGSNILKAAFEVNQGKFPSFTNFIKERGDCSLLAMKDQDKICGALTKVVTQVFPKYYPEFDIKTDLQILSPYNKGPLGSIHLNKVMQELLNPETRKSTTKNYVEFGPCVFYKGDKVIQIQNDYEKNVFNGDIGIVSEIFPEYDELVVDFPHTQAHYTVSDLPDLRLGYTISIHKAQGSEVPAVILILHESHYPLLQKNLLYTGITRAKNLLICISTDKVIETAIKNNVVQSRNTLLKERIKGEIHGTVLA